MTQGQNAASSAMVMGPWDLGWDGMQFLAKLLGGGEGEEEEGRECSLPPLLEEMFFQ